MSTLFDSIARSIESSPTRSAEQLSKDSDIFDAIEKKDLNLVKKFLISGKTKLEDTYPSPMVGVYEGYTPLAYACSMGSTEIVEFLIQKGADPNKCIRQQIDVIYPVHIACKFGHVSVLQLLEKYNSRTHVKSQFDNETPMFFAVTAKQYDIVERLLEMGVRDIDYNNNGMRCIHLCCELMCQKNRHEKDINAYRKLFGLLLRYHDTNYTDDYFNCKTMRVSIQSRESERERIENDRKANRTPLLILTELNGDKESIGLLLKHADVNCSHPISRKTPLHYACQNNNEQIVHSLLLNGANKSATDNDGNVPNMCTTSKSIMRMIEKFTRFDTIIENVKRREMIRKIDEIIQKGSITNEKIRDNFINALEYMKSYKIDQIEKQISNLESTQSSSLESEMKIFFSEYLVNAALSENKDAIRILIKKYDVDINQLTKKGVRKNEIIEYARQCFLDRKEKIMLMRYNGSEFKFPFTSSTTEFDLRNFVSRNIIKNRIITMREIRFRYVVNSKELFATTSDLFKQMINDAYESMGEEFVVMMEYDMEDWTKLRQLGKGQYGVVWLCLDHNDKSLFALKIIDKDRIKRELDVYKKDSVKHENIIQYFDSKLGNGKYYVKLQYLPGGNLYELVKYLDERRGPLTISRIALYTRQLLLAIKYLHDRGIYHCDIKPHNILIDNQDCIKLSDFGESNEGTVMNTTFGTTCYLPGDIFKSKSVTIDYSIDIWSVGVTVFQLLIGGKNPYELIPGFEQKIAASHNIPNTVKNFVAENWEKLVDCIPNSCDGNLKKFIRKCFKSKGRPTAEKLLNHSFLKRRASTPNLASLKSEDSQETNLILQYLNERQTGAKREEEIAPQLIENLTNNQTLEEIDETSNLIQNLSFNTTNKSVQLFISSDPYNMEPVTPNHNMVGLNLGGICDRSPLIDDTNNSVSALLLFGGGQSPGEESELL